MDPVKQVTNSERIGPGGGIGLEPETPAQNWIPLIVAAVLLGAVVVAGLILSDRPKTRGEVTPITTPLDPYADRVPITNVAMSESGNLAGGKLTYIDGHITNTGDRTVTGITVQVLFRNYAHEVAQNETMPLKLIRTRDPYIDTQSVSAAPLRAGDQRDFRLIFDRVSPDWSQTIPEIRVLHVDAR